MRAIIVVLGLTGCDALFSVTEVKAPATPDDSGVDGISADARPGCFRDEFVGGNVELALNWDRVADSASCDIVADQGALLGVYNANVACYAYAETNVLQSFVGARATVKIVDVIQFGDAESYFAMTASAGNWYAFYYGRDELDMTVRVGGTDMQTVGITYDPAAHKYWRIEHQIAPPAILFSTSPNGTDFTQRHSVDILVPVNSMRAELGAGTYNSGLLVQGTARFDDFELCMP